MPTSTRSHSLVAAVFLLALASVATCATPPGPMATVKSASNRIIAVLSDPKVARRDRWSLIAPVIAESFDFQSMSMSILSRQWQSATPAQQKEFTRYFSQYIESTYRSKLEAYSGQRIEYTSEKVRGQRAAVSSVIHAEGTRIPVSYYLRQDELGIWKAYDLTIEGVSLVNSYRETYAAIAKSSGISGVLAHVQRRARESSMARPAVTKQ